MAYTYANEADMLNVVLFEKTAKQWKDENPAVKGNMRDAATLNQLLVLANLESYNAVLINQGKENSKRTYGITSAVGDSAIADIGNDKFE